MGVIGLIANIKAKALQGQGKIVNIKKDYIQKTNVAEAELTRQKQELREAQQIRADLRADQMKPVEGQQPSKMKNLGKGMAKHMNKGKATPRLGVPTSRTPSGGAAQGGIFGGQRNIEVGGNSGSPFGQTKNLDVGGTGGSPFNVGGRAKPPAVKPKRTTIIIKQ